ncbi:MAG TPA: hypothetical protein VFF63_05315 [Candidatus Babeliales bacterium]|nr:hypothetical protein [Candidatus Babeliales bacterium]
MGGNASTLAIVNSLRPSTDGADKDTIRAHLIPMAWTPLGIVVGEGRQAVNVAFADLFDWIDRTFPPRDDHAFVVPLRELELLARIGWASQLPDRLDEATILNLEDLPEDVAESLGRPAVALVQCAACRRLCARDDFVWKARQLCAWDYHAQVFGKRGPWRAGAFEASHLELSPTCAYVVPELLAELHVEIVLTTGALPDATVSAIVNTALGAGPTHAHMALRTPGGLTVLREA